MRRAAALVALSFGMLFASFLIFSTPVSAKNICACTCFDSQETTSLLRPGTDLDACTSNVCNTACTEINSTQVEDETAYNPSTGRCVCACQATVKKLEYTSLTAGNTQCLGDCSTKCGGQANVFQDNTTPKIMVAPCVPGVTADCKVGAYAQYQGVACVLRPDQDTTTWPNGKPACVLPVNLKNANLECKNQGGIAKGGTCGFIGSGESPDSYFKSRPFFKQDGTYGVTEYKDSYADVSEWTSFLDAQWRSAFPGRTGLDIARDIPPGAGICYQWGALYGGLPEGAGLAVPANDYVCLKKKSDLCGHIDPPASYPVRTPARMFRCQGEADYLSQFPTKGQDFINETCLQAEGACVQPGYICCPSQKPGSCLKDSDCSLDSTKICNKTEGLLSYGTCVWNPICDPDPNHNQDPASGDPAAPWLTDIRRCRAATPMEIADKEICSDEVPESIGPQRCPGTGQACCRPQNTQALSSCAADKTSGAGPASVWNDFACMNETALPSAEYVDMPDGRKLKTLIENDTGYTGGNCLPPAAVKSGGGSQPRCPTGKLCCNAEAIKAEGGADIRAGQKEKGAECGKAGDTVLRCYEKLALGPETDAAAQERGFANADQYFEQIARSSYCKVTPLEPGGSIYQNTECRKETLCCSLRISQKFPCDPSNPDADTVCNQYAPTCDTNPETCLKCDPELKLCVDAGLLDQAAASESCFVRSQAFGDEGASEIGKINNDPSGETFSCQYISPETPGIEQKCVGFGCDNFAAPGKTSACCVPGVGETAAAAAQGAAADVEVKAAPYSLALPACIGSGNCTLNDIVGTGAAFANFLIGISGSVFLAIFVYGGFMYLTAGSSERAAKGKKMIIHATLAMVLIMGAYIFVSFIQSSLVSSASGSKEKPTCGQTPETSGKDLPYACTFLRSAPEDKKALDAEVSERKCVKKLCPGPANYVCCPS